MALANPPLLLRSTSCWRMTSESTVRPPSSSDHGSSGISPLTYLWSSGGAEGTGCGWVRGSAGHKAARVGLSAKGGTVRGEGPGQGCTGRFDGHMPGHCPDKLRSCWPPTTQCKRRKTGKITAKVKTRAIWATTQHRYIGGIVVLATNPLDEHGLDVLCAAQLRAPRRQRLGAARLVARVAAQELVVRQRAVRGRAAVAPAAVGERVPLLRVHTGTSKAHASES